jgi:large subunit ribosomal protein L13
MPTKSFQIKDADRKWYLVDANGQILGRVATVITDLLRGKNKVTFTPNSDGGDNVVVINASGVKLSKDSKLIAKSYHRHSGYMGGLKSETFEEAMEKHPERVIHLAVKGMLQKNKMAEVQATRLRVYAGSDHKHTQELIPVILKGDKK